MLLPPAPRDYSKKGGVHGGGGRRVDGAANKPYKAQRKRPEELDSPTVRLLNYIALHSDRNDLQV